MGRSRKLAARPKSDPVWEAHEERQRQRDPASWGVGLANLSLASASNVDAQLDFKGRVRRALRLDVFSLLFYRRGASLSSQSYDAVRRFQKDLAILHATQGSSEAIRTSGCVAFWLTENFSIGRAEAGARVQRALAGMPTQAREIMRSLCEPEVVRGQIVDWHATVHRLTGERNRIRRGELVRDACDALAASYRDIDNRPR